MNLDVDFGSKKKQHTIFPIFCLRGKPPSKIRGEQTKNRHIHAGPSLAFQGFLVQSSLAGHSSQDFSHKTRDEKFKAFKSGCSQSVHHLKAQNVRRSWTDNTTSTYLKITCYHNMLIFTHFALPSRSAIDLPSRWYAASLEGKYIFWTQCESCLSACPCLWETGFKVKATLQNAWSGSKPFNWGSYWLDLSLGPCAKIHCASTNTSNF